MLRLFALRDIHTGRMLATYFPSKPEARAERDKLNEAHPLAPVCITYGPDHRLYAGSKK